MFIRVTYGDELDPNPTFDTDSYQRNRFTQVVFSRSEFLAESLAEQPVEAAPFWTATPMEAIQHVRNLDQHSGYPEEYPQPPWPDDFWNRVTVFFVFWDGQSTYDEIIFDTSGEEIIPLSPRGTSDFVRYAEGLSPFTQLDQEEYGPSARSDASPAAREEYLAEQSTFMALIDVKTMTSDTVATNMSRVLEVLPNDFTRFLTNETDFNLKIQNEDDLVESMILWMTDFVVRGTGRTRQCFFGAALDRSGAAIFWDEFVNSLWFLYGFYTAFALLLWCCFCQPFNPPSEEAQEKKNTLLPTKAALTAWCYVPLFASIRLIYFKLLIVFESNLQAAFKGLAKKVSKWPRTVCWLFYGLGMYCLIVVFVFTRGPRDTWMNSDVEGLWASPDSVVLNTADYFLDNFPTGSVLPRTKCVMIFSAADGEFSDLPDNRRSILSKELLEALADVENEFLSHPNYYNVTTEEGDVIPTCYFLKAPELCVARSPLDYWRDNPVLVDATDNSTYTGVDVGSANSTDPLGNYTRELDEFEETFEELYNRTLDPRATHSHGMPIWRNDVFDSPIANRFCSSSDAACQTLAWAQCNELVEGCDACDWDRYSTVLPNGYVRENTYPGPHVCAPSLSFLDWIDENRDYYWNAREDYAKFYEQSLEDQNGEWTDLDDHWAAWGTGGLPQYFRLTYFRLPTDVTGSSEWTDFFMSYELPDDSPLQIVGRFSDEDVQASVRAASRVPIPMVMGVVLGITSYILFAFCRRDMTKSRMMLGFMGLQGTFLGLVVGIYICLMLLGERLSTTVVIVPVVILSIGVDDMFLLTDAFDETSSSRSPESRVVEAVQSAGLAMTMTTVTDALAFLLGALSTTEAVRVMSLYAFVCILCDFTFQITYFPALMTLDARRSLQGRWDASIISYFCHGGGSAYRKLQEDHEEKEKQKESDGSDGDNDNDDDDDAESEHDEHVSGFLGNWLGPLIVQRCMAIVVVSIFALLCVGSVLLIAVSLEQGMGLDTVIDASNASGEFLVAERNLFRNPVSSPADLLHVSGPSGVTNISVGLGPEGVHFPDSYDYRDVYINNVQMDRRDIPLWVIASWRDSFDLWASDESDDVYPTEYQGLFDRWWADNDTRLLFEPDIVFDEQGEYVASKAWTVALLPHSVGRPSDWTGITGDRFRSIRWFSPDLALLEPTLDASNRLAIDSLWTALIVGVVAVFFLQHPSASLLMVFAFISVVLICLGGMAVFAMPLNAFSQVSLIIALGLSIDYIAHITHGFVSAPGNRQEKAVHSLAVHGPAVANGMLTTAIGMTALGFLGHVQLVKGFAWLILLVQVVGLAHAFILMPALLSLLGPRTFRNPVLAVLIENNKAQVRPGDMGAVDLVSLRGTEIFSVSGAQAGAADARAVQAAELFSRRRAELHPDLYDSGRVQARESFRESVRLPSYAEVQRETFSGFRDDLGSWMDPQQEVQDYRYRAAARRIARRNRKNRPRVPRLQVDEAVSVAAPYSSGNSAGRSNSAGRRRSKSPGGRSPGRGQRAASATTGGAVALTPPSSGQRRRSKSPGGRSPARGPSRSPSRGRPTGPQGGGLVREDSQTSTKKQRNRSTSHTSAKSGKKSKKGGQGRPGQGKKRH